MFMCSRCEAFGRCSSLPLKMEKISKIMIRKAMGVENRSILFNNCCSPEEYEQCCGNGKYTLEKIDKELDMALPYCLFKQ